MPRIDDVAPDRAFYRPGETARVTIRLSNERPAPVTATLRLSLDHLGETVATESVLVTVPARNLGSSPASRGAKDPALSQIRPLKEAENESAQPTNGGISRLEPAYVSERGVFSPARRRTRTELTATSDPAAALSAVQLTLTPPPTPMLGYGLDAELVGEDGAVLARGGGALDVLERWSDSPRYGFLADFGPDLSPESIAACCRSLNRLHLNVVQFYDWMWRHYRLLPSAPDYTDALGRRLSLASVRAAIAGVQAHGAAALAYGALYGAEPEFADVHPELALFDDTGQRISLAKLFYIMNVAPGSPWVPRIVAEFAAAVRELGFDGIHLDQYGFPKTALTATGDRVELAGHFPPLIEAARAAVQAERPGAGVIFNAVANWPIETVAATSQDATYIEVWPPDETYNDLLRLIRTAKRLGSDKPVILAAYLAPFLDAAPEDLPGAEAAALLATAAIATSGGSHLLLGEENGILCDPYYSRYATLRPGFVPVIRAYYDFLVRYEELLVAPAVTDWEDAAITLTGAHATPEATAGAVWLIPRRTPGYWVIHLINLTNQADTHWNARRTPPAPLMGLELSILDVPDFARALWVTPDANQGPAVTLRATSTGKRLQIKLPELCHWGMILLGEESTRQ